MSGYTHCGCRDCFEIVVDGGLCDECLDAGCSDTASDEFPCECQALGAYGQDAWERHAVEVES